MTGETDEFGPATVTCPHCFEKVEIAAGPTRRTEIQHGDCDWMMVDLVHEAAGKGTWLPTEDNRRECDHRDCTDDATAVYEGIDPPADSIRHAACDDHAPDDIQPVRLLEAAADHLDDDQGGPSTTETAREGSDR